MNEKKVEKRKKGEKKHSAPSRYLLDTQRPSTPPSPLSLHRAAKARAAATYLPAPGGINQAGVPACPPDVRNL
jgi:hypothetical protein